MRPVKRVGSYAPSCSRGSSYAPSKKGWLLCAQCLWLGIQRLKLSHVRSSELVGRKLPNTNIGYDASNLHGYCALSAVH